MKKLLSATPNRLASWASAAPQGSLAHTVLHGLAALTILLLANVIGDMIDAPLVGLAGLLVSIGWMLWSINSSTDQDPASERVQLDDSEELAAVARLPWVQSTLNELALQAGVRELRSVRFANCGASYRPVEHRIRVSRALCARLSDQDLRLILAHEVGHAVRRWATLSGAFSESARIEEELLADATALQLIAASPRDWDLAIEAVQRAEGHPGVQRELRARRLALGLPVDGIDAPA